MSDLKRAAESPEPLGPLEEQQRRINEGIRVAKKRVKGQGSFNTRFWASSCELESLRLQRAETDRKLSLRDFEGLSSEWEQTDSAQSIFQQIKAQKTTIQLYQKRADEMDSTQKGRKKRTLRDAFMKLFSTSKMGIGIMNTGQGARDSSMQSNFRQELIDTGDAKHPEFDFLWCPIIGDWCEEKNTQAAHLFPYMHGQEVMDSIFGKKDAPELFSPRNGLLVCGTIERYFDSGKFVIVPDLPDRPPVAELLSWVQAECRDYRLRIIDPKWEKLDHPVSRLNGPNWRSLDGKKLEFRTKFRPAGRYLYFHYCIQVLRRAWGQNGLGGSLPVLKDEIGRPFWGTPGRYMPKNMLLALVEELGHDYKGLLEGAGCSRGDSKLLIEAAAKQINKRPALKGMRWQTEHDEKDGSDSNYSDLDSGEGSVA
ncbi:hypothetical protein BJX76DRAFT_369006 [Aspergillus varians]